MPGRAITAKAYGHHAYSVVENRAQHKGNFPGRASLLVFSTGITLFAVGCTVGYHFHSSFLLLGYIGVALMALTSLVGMSAGQHSVLPEIRWMWLFCLWAMCSGVFIVQDYALFSKGVERLLQISVIAFCVAGFSARVRSPALGLGAILAVALLLGIYGLLTGNFGSITELNVVRGTRITGVRATSMVANANSLGVNAVWGFVAVTYFAAVTRNRWLRVLLWCCVPLLITSMLASGSRKGLLLPIIYIGTWVWFCNRKWLFRGWQSAIQILALAAILAWGFQWVLDNTFVGLRLKRSVDTEQLDGSSESRLEMYKEALVITSTHPIAGVGLSQWSLYGTGGYAHNEYGELAATTGIVGLGLYLWPYFLTVRRLICIRRITREGNEYQRAGLCLALLITFAAAGFGQVLFSGQTYWVLVGSVWGYAYGVSRSLMANQPPHPRNLTLSRQMFVRQRPSTT